MDTGWRRLKTREEFVEVFAEVPLVGEGVRFIIHEDGRINGRVGNQKLSGKWYWTEEYFCRTAELDGKSLDLDCEVVECCGSKMRYTRERGRGEASIVEIERG